MQITVSRSVESRNLDQEWIIHLSKPWKWCVTHDYIGQMVRKLCSVVTILAAIFNLCKFIKNSIRWKIEIRNVFHSLSKPWKHITSNFGANGSKVECRAHNWTAIFYLCKFRVLKSLKFKVWNQKWILHPPNPWKWCIKINFRANSSKVEFRSRNLAAILVLCK